MKKALVFLLSVVMASGFAFGAAADKKLDTDSATLKLIENFETEGKFTVDKTEFKEGAGAAKVDIPANGHGIVERQYHEDTPSSFDLSAYAGKSDAYVYVWLYLDNAQALVDGAEAWFELSSGTYWGSQVDRVNLTELEGLKNGWNELYIPVTDFVSHPDVGACDWSAVNYFRIYFKSTVAQTMRVDGLYIGMEADFNKQDTEDTTADPSGAPATTKAPANAETGASFPVGVFALIAGAAIVAVVVAGAKKTARRGA